MKVWIAVACCVALGGLAAVVPREALVASVHYLRWIHALVFIAVVMDSRRLGLGRYAAGLGSRAWVFWLMMVLWPVAAVPWYLTMREWIVTGRMPRRAGEKVG